MTERPKTKAPKQATLVTSTAGGPINLSTISSSSYILPSRTISSRTVSNRLEPSRLELSCLEPSCLILNCLVVSSFFRVHLRYYCTILFLFSQKSLWVQPVFSLYLSNVPLNIPFTRKRRCLSRRKNASSRGMSECIQSIYYSIKASVSNFCFLNLDDVN